MLLFLRKFKVLCSNHLPDDLVAGALVQFDYDGSVTQQSPFTKKDISQAISSKGSVTKEELDQEHDVE